LKEFQKLYSELQQPGSFYILNLLIVPPCLLASLSK